MYLASIKKYVSYINMRLFYIFIFILEKCLMFAPSSTLDRRFRELRIKINPFSLIAKVNCFTASVHGESE